MGKAKLLFLTMLYLMLSVNIYGVFTVTATKLTTVSSLQYGISSVKIGEIVINNDEHTNSKLVISASGKMSNTDGGSSLGDSLIYYLTLTDSGSGTISGTVSTLPSNYALIGGDYTVTFSSSSASNKKYFVYLNASASLDLFEATFKDTLTFTLESL